jgi:hypothetical protein
MPFDPEKSGDVKKVTEKLRKTYKNISDTAARQAIHVFNSVMDSTGDEGKAWASVYSKMNERGLAKNAGIEYGLLGEPYYEIKVGGFGVDVVPLTYSDDDWERTGDGGVRLEMGNNKYTLLNKEQFARLIGEWEKAAALVKRVHSAPSRTASGRKQARMARNVAALYATLKK